MPEEMPVESSPSMFALQLRLDAERERRAIAAAERFWWPHNVLWRFLVRVFAPPPVKRWMERSRRERAIRRHWQLLMKHNATLPCVVPRPPMTDEEAAALKAKLMTQFEASDVWVAADQPPGAQQ